MKPAALIAIVAIALSAAGAGAAERFRPAAPDFVVLRVPARRVQDPIFAMEQRVLRSSGDQGAVAKLAALYVERARALREPRYFGRAEQLLRPWVARADVTAATLRVQADILQNRHDFVGARRLLDEAIGQDPRDGSARLMRASISMVQGRAADARGDCAAVLASGASAAGTVCFAQVLGATGQLAQAQRLLTTLLGREVAGVTEPAAFTPGYQLRSHAPDPPSRAPTFSSPPAMASSDSARREMASDVSSPREVVSSGAVQIASERAVVRDALPASVLGWALWVMADFADRRGEVSQAERLLRAALSATPENEGVRSALVDALLARGAVREALRLLQVPAPSVGLLARRAHAQQLLGDDGLVSTRTQLDELLSLASRRGERPHLREEALLALDVEHDAAQALELARRNFESQRETIDVRLLVRAARATGNSAALAEVMRWLHDTHFEDRALAELRT